jgi:Transposase
MSSSADRVEVFAGIQRRRRYSVDQKLAVLEEAGQPGMTISYIARRHGISPSLVFGSIQPNIELVRVPAGSDLSRIWPRE